MLKVGNKVKWERESNGILVQGNIYEVSTVEQKPNKTLFSIKGIGNVWQFNSDFTKINEIDYLGEIRNFSRC